MAQRAQLFAKNPHLANLDATPIEFSEKKIVDNVASTYSGSEAGSNVDIEDKLGLGAISSGNGKTSFDEDWIRGTGQTENLLEKQKESLGRFFFQDPLEPGDAVHLQRRRPWVDLLPVNSEQPKPKSTPRQELHNARVYQSLANFPPRDIESQEIRERPAWRAGTVLRFYSRKIFCTLGRNIIKLFYPPSRKKARRLLALMIIATAFTNVALLWRAGHSSADMSLSVMAICALGEFLYQMMADPSKQEFRHHDPFTGMPRMSGEF
ncbi:hypothetical protein MMC07_000357 [Pseudocyphellaria aurata]|nr:hypothetical protein [Pseudocyphellaria aurata]